MSHNRSFLQDFLVFNLGVSVAHVVVGIRTQNWLLELGDLKDRGNDLRRALAFPFQLKDGRSRPLPASHFSHIQQLFLRGLLLLRYRLSRICLRREVHYSYQVSSLYIISFGVDDDLIDA